MDVHPDRDERRDALDQRLCAWLLAAGCIPVPVPNTMVSLELPIDGAGSILERWLAAISPAVVILSGGNDVGVCPERDLTERIVLSWAQGREVPVLGICRGMQMMAVWAGGALMPVRGHARARHLLRPATADHSWPDEVNSYHNLALDGFPPGFEATARAEDGTIEAIRHTRLPWEGWMWHPEREREFSVPDLIRARRLFGG